MKRLIYWGFLVCLAYLACMVTSEDGDPWPCNTTNETCSEGGFVGDPEDCTKYYRCGSGGLTIHRQSCAPGTYFNRVTKVCGFGTDNCEPPCPTYEPYYAICDTVNLPCRSGYRYPDKLQCDMYHECQSDGTYVTRHCRIDWTFDACQQTCQGTKPASEVCPNRCTNQCANPTPAPTSSTPTRTPTPAPTPTPTPAP